MRKLLFRYEGKRVQEFLLRFTVKSHKTSPHYRSENRVESMQMFFTSLALIFTILSLILMIFYSGMSLFDKPSSVTRKQLDRQPTSQKPPLVHTTKQQQPQPQRLQPRSPDIQSIHAGVTIVSQPWQQFISVLKVFDDDFYRSSIVSDWKSRLPSCFSSAEFISVLKVFDDDFYRSSALSDLKDRLPSRLSLGELNLILELFDDDFYRSRVRSDLKYRLTLD